MSERGDGPRNGDIRIDHQSEGRVNHKERKVTSKSLLSHWLPVLHIGVTGTSCSFLHPWIPVFIPEHFR